MKGCCSQQIEILKQREKGWKLGSLPLAYVKFSQPDLTTGCALSWARGE